MHFSTLRLSARLKSVSLFGQKSNLTGQGLVERMRTGPRIQPQERPQEWGRDCL